LPISPQLIEQGLLQSGYSSVDITSRHVKILSALKDVHRDPFDRIMIAQALVENFSFLTCDVLLTRYGEQVIYYAR
jgi:PIN domain nuclease of toxin-antitoxin system